MSRRHLSHVLAFAVLLTAATLPEARAQASPTPAPPHAAAPAAAASGAEVVLRDGTRIPCKDTPVVAFGRVVYRSIDGVQHALLAELVDLEKTKAAQPSLTPSAPAGSPTAGGGAPVPIMARPIDPGSRREAPDFEAKTPDGKTVKLSDLKGKVVLVDFWATWCGPCIVEMPVVKKVYAAHPRSDFEILGVSLDQDRAKLDAFLKAQGMAWPQNFDGKGWGSAVARAYGVSSIPRAVLVDRQGRIARAGLRGDALENAVSEALKEPAPKK